jgi:hypothetical protein
MLILNLLNYLTASKTDGVTANKHFRFIVTIAVGLGCLFIAKLCLAYSIYSLFHEFLALSIPMAALSTALIFFVVAVFCFLTGKLIEKEEPTKEIGIEGSLVPRIASSFLAGFLGTRNTTR